MRKTVSGFTLIEILVVTIIVTVLASIGVVVYTSVRNDADQKQAEGLVGIVRASLERYYNAKGDYPDPVALSGSSGGTATSTMSANDYITAANMLSTSADTLGSAKFQFFPCKADSCTAPSTTNDKIKLFYIARVPGDAAVRNITFGSCTATIPATTDPALVGTSSYVLAFLKPGSTTWATYRSAQGNVAFTNPATCKFDT